jgi:tetratricopeptide (TPR) repeat protein
MNALIMGLPYGADSSVIRLFRSRRGHDVRFLNIAGDADYRFEAKETATEVVERIRREWPVDVFVCWCPEMFPPPCEIERCPVKTVAIVSDWNIYFPQLEHNLARYDLVLSDRLGSQVLPLFETSPQYFFPLYAQRTLTHRALGLPKDLDVVFVGNLNHVIHVQRGRCLEKVAALSDRYRILITGGKEPEEYTELLNRARIVFNHSLRSEMNLRCFEALACGSVLFLEESNLEVRDYLQNGVEVVLYNEDTLQDLLEKYLPNPGLLDTIAAAGQALAPQLAGESRLDTLLDWLEAQPVRERPFSKLSEHQQALANVLQYATSLAASQRVLARHLLDEALQAYPDDPAFTVARAATLLEQMPHAGDRERKELVREALALFHRAAAAVPEAAPIWMNMAFVAQLAGAVDAERQFLEHVLRSDSTAFGNLLLGRVNDPYYIAWRRALAFGDARVSLLHAGAAARLAEMALMRGEDVRARAYARKAIAAEPAIALPYRVQAQAMLRLGNLAAARDLLEKSLPLTAFDMEHRTLLVDVYLRAGCRDSAADLVDASVRIFSACPEHEAYAAELSKLARDLAG